MSNADSPRGKWLVIGIIGGAIVLGLTALRYRQLMPKQPPLPTTTTLKMTTQPAPSATQSSGESD